MKTANLSRLLERGDSSFGVISSGDDQQAHSLRSTGRRARSGGTPLVAPFETRIVGEEDVVPLVSEGRDIVKELSGGRIIVRRRKD